MFKILFTPERSCRSRNCSMCCTYFTQLIEKPRKKKDFENLLWQISHDSVQVFKNEDGWYLLVNTPCQHLIAEGECGIYDMRPSVCRDHGNDICEYDVPKIERFDLFFPDYKSLLKYCKKRFKNWGGKKKKKKKK